MCDSFFFFLFRCWVFAGDFKKTNFRFRTTVSIIGLGLKQRGRGKNEENYRLFGTFVATGYVFGYSVSFDIALGWTKIPHLSQFPFKISRYVSPHRF